MGTTLDTSRRTSTDSGQGRRSNDRSNRPRSQRDRTGARWQVGSAPLQTETLKMPGMDPGFWDSSDGRGS